MKNFILIILLSSISSFSYAEGLDLSTHNTLIGKLEGSVKDINDKETRSKIYLRLADLFADKARILDANKLEKAAKNDREKAVDYYLAAYKTKAESDEARILLQLSHLYALLNQSHKAEKIFKNIIADRRNRSKKLVGEAYAGLGELEFRKSNFKSAEKYFRRAIAYPISKKVDVLQRLAWCEFNDGNYRTAEKIALNTLKEPNLSDAQKIDLSRDLTTFMAKNSITTAKINTLMSVTPNNAKKQNLFYLGQEADRLGNHSGSILVWAQVSQLEGITKEEKAEMKLRQAQSAIDEKKFATGLKDYAEFFQEFDRLSCNKNDICGELKAKSRNLVHNWIKQEKASPSIHLKQGLVIYSDNNGDDVEMIQWTGNIARFQKDYELATRKYAQAAKVAKEKKQTDSLLALLETAEESDSINIMRNAYNTYLNIQPTGSKASEVKYQLAYLLYREKKYAEAAIAFNKVTGDKSLSLTTREQAADLSLDALAIVEDRNKIEDYALSYAQTFPKNKVKFSTVARKAMVNDALIIFKSAKGNDSKIKSALNKLKKAPLLGASQHEILVLEKNKLEMTTELRQLDETDRYAVSILKNKQATAQDKEDALAKRLWVAESKLYFKTAYNIAQQMKFSNLDRASRELKMGILADLAGKNPKSYYENYIKYVSSRRAANVIRLELIKTARRPWSEFKNYERALLSTPDLYTQALVDVYGQEPNIKLLDKYARKNFLRADSGASALYYQLELATFDKYRQAFKGLKLSSRSDSQLAITLNLRIRRLNELESYTNQLLARGHFGVQIRALDLLSKEYNRLYWQILGLPVPKGLKVVQRKEYKKLIEAKALPYKQKSDQIQSQSKELWSSNKQLDSMLAELDKTSNGAKSLLIKDLNGIKTYAPKSIASKIASSIKDSQASKHQLLVKEFNKLKEDPFNTRQIERIKTLEAQRGKTAMVAFLESREEALKQGKM